jgi:hypothetical protein
MNLKKLSILMLVSGLFFTSCSDDDNEPDFPLGAYDNGLLILNQGNFGGGNSSISYWSSDLTDFQLNAYGAVNPNIPLGDTGQDIGFYQDKAFVVMNFSETIQVLNRYTLAHIATISTGLKNPRYITFSNGKGFVTNWGDPTDVTDDYVAVLDLSNYTITTSISVVEGPERILEENGKIYVAHLGGYGYGNSISIINASNNTVSGTIAVGDVPNAMFTENNTLYVLGGGKAAWTNDETLGTLTKIDLSNNAILGTFNFSAGEHPSNLVEENGKMYYTIDGAIYTASITATALPSSSIFSTNPQGVYGVYSFAVKEDKIYVGDALDFNSNGKIYIYSLTGTVLHEETVGIIPAGFHFND